MPVVQAFQIGYHGLGGVAALTSFAGLAHGPNVLRRQQTVLRVRDSYPQRVHRMCLADFPERQAVPLLEFARDCSRNKSPG